MGAVTTAASARAKLPEPSINVTPLVDIVLVLLIIFMVIMPALEQGASVELPAAARVDAKPRSGPSVEVTLTARGEALVDREVVAPAELPTRLAELHAANPDRHLVLRADASLAYEDVRRTLAALETIGWKGLSLKVSERKAARP